jgi:hypothetical protein
MVVGEIRAKHAAEMPVVEDDHVVQTLAAIACEPSLKMRVSDAQVEGRSACRRDEFQTLPFSCLFRATRSSKRQQTAAQSEGRKSPDSTSDVARSGNVQHTAQSAANASFSA